MKTLLMFASLVTGSAPAVDFNIDCRSYMLAVYDYTMPALTVEERDYILEASMKQFIGKALQDGANKNDITTYAKYAIHSNDEDHINEVESTVLRLCIGNPDVNVIRPYSMAFYKEFKRFPFDGI